MGRSGRIVATIIVAAAVLTACGGGGGGNAGAVDPAVFHQCGQYGAAAAIALEGYLKGTQTAAQTVTSLAGAQRGLNTAAAHAKRTPTGNEIQALSDAVAKAKTGIADGSLGPLPATKIVVDAANRLPTNCK